MKKRIEIETGTLGKAFLIFILLLITAFAIGLYLGKESEKSSVDYRGDDAIKVQMNECSYKIQELTQKYIILDKLAKEKGIMDDNGMPVKDVKCAVEADQPKAEQPKAEPAAPVKAEPPVQEKPDEVKPAAKKPDEEKSDDAKPAAEKKAVKKESAKKTAPAEQSSAEKCAFSIQIYADNSREKAVAFQKKVSIGEAGDTRIVEAEVKGTTWYRIRYGCYKDRAEAQEHMDDVKKKIKNPIITAE